MKLLMDCQYGIGPEEIESRIDYYLDYFELSGYRKTFPPEPEPGRKTALDACRFWRAPLCNFGWATAGLDLYGASFWGLSVKDQSGRYGVIFVSHQAKFVETYAIESFIRRDDRAMVKGKRCETLIPQ